MGLQICTLVYEIESTSYYLPTKMTQNQFSKPFHMKLNEIKVVTMVAYYDETEVRSW